MNGFFHNLKRKIPFDNLLYVKRAAKWRWLGYLLFAIIFAGILTFYKFPYESLENKLGAAIAERWGMRLDVTDLRPILPPVLKFDQLSLQALDYEGQQIFSANEGYLRARILPLFGGSLAVTIRTAAYGGSLKGDITLKPFYNVRKYRLKASWQAVQLERHPFLVYLVERQISGKLYGDLQLDGSLKELASSSGGGKLRLMEGSFPIEYPYLKMKTLEQLEVSATIRLDGGELEINNCKFRAEGIEGTLDGTVQLQSKLYESVLDISGECKIDPTLLNLASGSNQGLTALLGSNNPMPFHLRGTVTAPRLSLF